jgi:hypothetical protein
LAETTSSISSSTSTPNTPFFGHPQSNDYYNGYINGSQEGLNQGLNALRDPSDYCAGLDPHDNFCRGWSQGYEDAWQYGCDHGGRKYFLD